MQISPETQQFIREHQSNDIRALALLAKKYPNVDMPTAITQIAGRQTAAENPIVEGDRRYMVSETFVIGTMLFGNHRPLQGKSPAR